MRVRRALTLVLAVVMTSPVTAVGQQNTPADTSKKTAPNTELPILPARRTTFTTDEGTWLSLDVSPDGKTIAFDLMGDLYTLPIAGGKATRITSGMGFDGQPRFSPDGKTIVFVSDRSGYENLWIIDVAGGEPRAITKDKDAQYLSPTWTPDGQYIVVSRTKTGILGSTYDLVMVNKDGGTGLQLTGPGTGVAPTGPPNPLVPPPYNNYLGASVSPDGRYIYAAVKRGGFKYDQMLTDRWQLGVYDRNTGQTYLRTSSLGGGMRPAISPDGKWLAYGSRIDAGTGLRLPELASGDEIWLARDIQRDDSSSRFTRDLLPGYAWMPDPRGVVITYGGKLWRLALPNGTASAIPFSVDVEIGMGPLVKFEYPMKDSVLDVKQIRNARPSPDGKQLVFSALDKLWLMDLPNGRPRRLTTGSSGEHSPAWSPDGRYVAYAVASHGAAWRRVLVRDVRTSQDLDDDLRGIKDSPPYRTADARGFFYVATDSVRAAAAGVPPRESGQRLLYHRVGRPQREDEVMFESVEHPSWRIEPSVSQEGQYLVIALRERTETRNRIYFVDLDNPKRPNLSAPLVKLFDTGDALYEFVASEGPIFFMRTSRNATRTRLVAVDINTPDERHWTPIVRETYDPLLAVRRVDDRFIAHRLHDAHSVLEIYGLDGERRGDIALPGAGTVAELDVSVFTAAPVDKAFTVVVEEVRVYARRPDAPTKPGGY